VGLFRSDPGLPGMLYDAFVGPPESRDFNKATGIVARDGDAILGELRLSAGEAVDVVALCVESGAVSPGAIVVTNWRTFVFRKGKVRKQYRHSEVAETVILQKKYTGMLVQIISQTAKLDYNPNDPSWFSHVLQVEVSTPRIAQAICSSVDQHLQS
jgi:hypothetical protein